MLGTDPGVRDGALQVPAFMEAEVGERMCLEWRGSDLGRALSDLENKPRG